MWSRICKPCRNTWVGYVLLDRWWSVQCFVDHRLSLCFVSNDVVSFDCNTTVSHVEQELPTLPQHLSGVRVARSLVICVVFYRSSFVPLFWSLYCVSFNLRLLITPLISSAFLVSYVICVSEELFILDYPIGFLWRLVTVSVWY